MKKNIVVTVFFAITLFALTYPLFGSQDLLKRIDAKIAWLEQVGSDPARIDRLRAIRLYTGTHNGWKLAPKELFSGPFLPPGIYPAMPKYQSHARESKRQKTDLRALARNTKEKPKNSPLYQQSSTSQPPSETQATPYNLRARKRTRK